MIFLIMDLDITPETIGVFILFIVIMFVLSRIVKFIMHAIAAGGAGFSFPWVVQYLGLDVGIVADVLTGLKFAALAVGLYVAYEMIGLIMAVIKLLFAPVKILTGNGTGKSEIKRLKNELSKIKKG